MSEEVVRDRIGRIVRNLQSLEFLLRAVLLNINKDTEPQIDDSDIVEGAVLPENSFTNYKSLGKLIDEYNRHNKKLGLGPELTKASVEIRDMIAHGRISSKEMDGIPVLYKFGLKNKERMIPVKRVVVLDNEWLGKAITQTLNDGMTMTDVLSKFGKVLQRGQHTIETVPLIYWSQCNNKSNNMTQGLSV